MSNQIHGQVLVPGQTTRWEPIAAKLQPDGTYAISCDTELVLDSGNINISNLKIGSVDQTSNTLRYVKVLDDGTVVVANGDLLIGFKAARTQDRGVFPHYFGLVDEDENWVIIKEDTSGNENLYTYSSGAGSFITAWGDRATTLVYNEYYNIF